MTSYVLDPVRFALKAASRLLSVGKPTEAPRVAQAPHAAPACGIQWAESAPEGHFDTVEDRYRMAWADPSKGRPATSD